MPGSSDPRAGQHGGRDEIVEFGALRREGQLVAVRASNGSVHALGVWLPVLSQIAMRGNAG